MKFKPFHRAMVGRGFRTVRARQAVNYSRLCDVEWLEPRNLLATDVLVNHIDVGNTGQDLTETVLTPSNVISSSFGKRFTTTLDGQLYAQVLAKSNVNITIGTSQGIHDVLFAATMHDSLYAIDANTGAILWHDSFLQIGNPQVVTGSSAALGVTTVPVKSGDNALIATVLGPELGILSTPVIDAATNIIYVETNTQELRNGTTPVSTFTSGSTDIHYVQRLWAINLSDGSVAIVPTNNPPASVEPSTGGQVIGDTILNPRTGNTPLFTGYNITLSSLTQSGGVATATVPSSATTGGMRVGDWINISGATPDGYNGNFQVTAITSSTTFQFNVSNSLASTATGTIVLGGSADYRYVAGPYIKGTGDNFDTFNASGQLTSTSNTDNWQVNTADSTSIFAGTTPTVGGYIAFNAIIQMNRVALTEINGTIFIGFASHGDDGPYYGWLLGYNAATLANTVAFVTAPEFEDFNTVSGDREDFDSQAGLWGSGGSISTDGTYLYFTTGNGAFNPNSNNFNNTYTSTDHGNILQLPLDSDYGDAVMKVAIDPGAMQANINVGTGVMNDPNGTYDPDGGYNANGFGLKVVDYFVPSNELYMNLQDEDLSSGAVLLLPNSVTSNVPGHVGDPMAVAAGKEGRIYLLDQYNLGGFNYNYPSNVDSNDVPILGPDPSTYDRVLDEYYYYETLHPGTTSGNETFRAYSTPSYFNGNFYVGLSGGPELGFSVANFSTGTSPPGSGVHPTPIFTSSTTYGGSGTTASISANNSSNGIIWNLDIGNSSSDSLVAYSASASGTVSPIFQTPSSGSSSLTAGVSGATGVKFSLPTVYNGMLYVGTGGGTGTGGHILGTVVGFGLTNTTLNTPASLAGQAVLSTKKIHLTWTRNTTTETETQVERSTDGTNWTTLAFLPNGANSYDDTNIVPGTLYFYRVTAISGPSSSAHSTTATVTFPNYVQGDWNLDGHFNVADILAMMQALTNLGGYQTSHNLSASDIVTIGDFDGDHVVTNADLQGALQSLLTGHGSFDDDSSSASSGTPGADNSPVPSPETDTRSVQTTPAVALPTLPAAAAVDEAQPVDEKISSDPPVVVNDQAVTVTTNNRPVSDDSISVPAAEETTPSAAIPETTPSLAANQIVAATDESNQGDPASTSAANSIHGVVLFSSSLAAPENEPLHSQTATVGIPMNGLEPNGHLSFTNDFDRRASDSLFADILKSRKKAHSEDGHTELTGPLAGLLERSTAWSKGDET